jgi:hypothetical protein
VQVRAAGELAHVAQGVYYADVAATGEYHETFASHVGDQRLIVEDQRVWAPHAAVWA